MVKRLILSLSILTFLNSCNVIDGNVVTTPEDQNDFEPFSKAVLLVEFTGHKCGNCPAGGEAGQQLKNAYRDRLIIIEAHVGTLAFPQPPASGKYTLDYRTPTGNAIDAEFGAAASGIPKGVVSYVEYNGTALVLPEAWAGKVGEQLQEETVPYAITANLSISGDILKLTASCEFDETLMGNFNLGAFLTEDSIISWQKDYRLTPQDIEFFDHSHALRGNFYSPGLPQILPWGLPLQNTNFVKGESESMELDIDIKPEYNQEKLNVVVFLFDRDSHTILQVREFHL